MQSHQAHMKIALGMISFELIPVKSFHAMVALFGSSFGLATVHFWLQEWKSHKGYTKHCALYLENKLPIDLNIMYFLKMPEGKS